MFWDWKYRETKNKTKTKQYNNLTSEKLGGLTNVKKMQYDMQFIYTKGIEGKNPLYFGK